MRPPLLLSDSARPEIRWCWRGPTFAPSAGGRDEVERWFAFGGEAESGIWGADGEPVAARQSSPEPVRVVRVPWVALVVACSLMVFVAMIVLTWLPTAASGLAVALFGGAFGVGAVLYPQPAAQVVAAAQPGFAVGLFAVLLLAAVRFRARRRVRHLPGFTRTARDPSAGSVPRARGSGNAPAPVGSGT